ncbi:MAG: histidine kinase [Bacteroidota bacterium]
MEKFKNREFRVSVQVLFWLFLISTLNLFFFEFDVVPGFYQRNWMMLGTVILLIIFNVYWLVPRFFAKKKYGKYSLLLLMCMGALILAILPIEQPLLEEMNKIAGMIRMFTMKKGSSGTYINFKIPHYFLKVVIYTAAAMASTVMESVQLHREQESLANKIKNEKLETEMKFLKSQINPHFLFNTLNNVYGLTLINSKLAPEVVMRLSEMLRYMLYESSHQLVALEKEAGYIKNFIALQQLKDEAPLSVKTCFKGISKGSKIAPMLLIPFVENAFKHSKIEDTKNGWIKIELTEKEGRVCLAVSNSISSYGFTKDKTGGIGLKNVKRRLDLQYAGRHDLLITKNGQRFDVSLEIEM